MLALLLPCSLQACRVKRLDTRGFALSSSQECVDQWLEEHGRLPVACVSCHGDAAVVPSLLESTLCLCPAALCLRQNQPLFYRSSSLLIFIQDSVVFD